MKYLGVLLSALLLTCVVGDTTDCSENYQKLLNDAAKVKKSCKEAGPKDCCQIRKIAPWSTTGSYEVADVCKARKEAFGVYLRPTKLYARCDMESAGGKWMVIQRRINGSVDFYRNWTDYVSGFGDLEGEFWYGLEKIHCLTAREDMVLRIELGNGTEPSIVWTYQLFRVGGADTNYQLTIGQGTGVGDSYDGMAYHNGMQFSTRDRNNNRYSGNCATVGSGGWWYDNCWRSNFNANHRNGLHQLGHGDRIYENIQMKIRPKHCSTDEDTSTCE